jgi:DNA-binding protein H-NS
VKSPRLTSMTLDALVVLRKKVDAAITKRISKERKRFQGLLQDLDGVIGRPAGSAPAAKRVYRKRRAKAAIKYRGPKGEKWSGRGMTPLWMRPLLKGGKKKEEFLVSAKKAKKR